MLVYMDLGRLDETEREWREVIREMPGYRTGWRSLCGLLISRGRTREAAALAGQMEKAPALRLEGLLAMSRLAHASGSAEEALGWLRAAMDEKADDLEVMRWSCQLLFEHGTTEEAEGRYAD